MLVWQCSSNIRSWDPSVFYQDPSPHAFLAIHTCPWSFFKVPMHHWQFFQAKDVQVLPSISCMLGKKHIWRLLLKHPIFYEALSEYSPCEICACIIVKLQVSLLILVYSKLSRSIQHSLQVSSARSKPRNLHVDKKGVLFHCGSHSTDVRIPRR